MLQPRIDPKFVLCSLVQQGRSKLQPWCREVELALTRAALPWSPITKLQLAVTIPLKALLAG